MAASQLATKGQPAHGGKSWPSKVFALNPAGLNWPRGAMILNIMLVPPIVFWAIGHEEYLLSALFGVLFTVVADPGGSYGQRVSRLALFALLGAGLTALGFGIGGDAWGWLVLAASVVTLVAGLAIMFGVHRFATALLLNVWFIITLAVAFGILSSTSRIITRRSPATPGLRWSPGPGGGALDRGDVHLVADPRAPRRAPAGRGDPR